MIAVLHPARGPELQPDPPSPGSRAPRRRQVWAPRTRCGSKRACSGSEPQVKVARRTRRRAVVGSSAIRCRRREAGPSCSAGDSGSWLLAFCETRKNSTGLLKLCCPRRGVREAEQTLGRPGGSTLVDPGMASPPPDLALCWSRAGGEGGSLARSAELEEKGDKCEPGAGGEALGRTPASTLGEGWVPPERNVQLTKSILRVPRKWSPAPAAVRWPAFPQRGALVPGPCNPFLWNRPGQRRPEWAGTWVAARCQALAAGAMSTPHPAHRLLESRVLPCEPMNIPQGGWRGRCGPRGFCRSGKRRLLPTFWTARLP